MRDTLSRTASVYQQRAHSAGSRFSYHYTVGVVLRRKQEQVARSIVHSQLLAVVNHSGENTVVRKPELCGVVLYFLTLRAVANEHHFVGDPLFGKYFKRVKYKLDTLVPKHSAHKNKHRHILVYTIGCAKLGGVVRLGSAPREIHAVLHNTVFALKAKTAEIFPRSVAYHPHLVAGGNIGYNKFGCLLCHKLVGQSGVYLDIEFCVVGEYQRRSAFFAQHPCHYRRRPRAVTVDNVKMSVGQLVQV